MRHPSHALILGLALTGTLAAALATPAPAEAQGALGRLRERAKQKVEQKAGDKMDTAIDRAVDGTPKGGTAAPTNAPGGAAGSDAAPAASAAAAAAQRPGEGAWANYDFVPGERVLFAEDFTRDRVGNFPQRLEMILGNMEVVEWQGQRWLRSNQRSALAITLPETLPERFTMELDLTVNWTGTVIYFAPRERDQIDDTHLFNGRWPDNFVLLSGVEVGAREPGRNGGSVTDPRKFLGQEPEGTLVRLRIDGDGRYVKVYLNENRVANWPSANLPRTNKVFIEMAQLHDDEKAMLIGNISINAGGRDMYDALSADGRVATQGIFFDTGSDRIRPESTPTLNEIRDMLKQHADLSLMIEGHTDNVGQAASNLTLSEKRAAAVRSYLVSQGIDASRLQSKGLGDTKPAGKNDTAEGRQTNRRVELVKI